MQQFQDRLATLRKHPFLKPQRPRRVLGIALGEHSALLAEVEAGSTTAHIAELVYPNSVSIATPVELGAALAACVKANHFTAKAAVVGLPARWLVTRQKEVPAADAKTTAEMLRLGAEAEFSSELKDLVYDFTGAGTTLLLIATPRRYVDAAVSICEAAGLSALAVTASALTLGDATARRAGKDVLVLSVSAGGAEVTSQRGSTVEAIRHLRSPMPSAPFISELRRAVSTLPTQSRGARDIILWGNAGLDAATLAEQLGSPVRSGELSQLGVATSNGAGRASNGQAINGQSNTRLSAGDFAAPICLALQGVSERDPAVDFLHSRLAPPKEHRIPRWVWLTGGALVVLVACSLYAFQDLQSKSAEVDQQQAKFDAMKDHIASAQEFVDKVTFAQAWHGGDPRYLACVRDMTLAMQEDPDTFAISLIIGDAPRLPGKPDTHALSGVLQGKAEDQQRVLKLLNALRRFPGFIEVSPGGSDAGRSREVTFSIHFTYRLASKSKTQK